LSEVYYTLQFLNTRGIVEVYPDKKRETWRPSQGHGYFFCADNKQYHFSLETLYKTYESAFTAANKLIDKRTIHLTNQLKKLREVKDSINNRRTPKADMELPDNKKRKIGEKA
jgi:hypothetical protein